MRKVDRKYWIAGGVAPLVILLDQITKLAIVERFRLGEVYPIIDGFFDLTLTYNTGAAFGFMRDADPAFRVPFFFLVPTVATLIILNLLRNAPPRAIRASVALGLVLGGAFGNLIDRVRIGKVIDFVLWHWKYEYQYPAFNVADSAIFVGVALLVVDIYLVERRAAREAA